MTRSSEHPISAVGLSIQRIVKEHPGIHFRGLGRAARLSSAGQLRHHLDRLERQGVLIEVEDGRYKRFFVAGQHDPKLRPEMARFARVVPRRIARLLLVNPMNRTELRRSLGCADSTLGYHLSRMVLMGDLAKSRGPNCCRYALTSEDLVRKMLEAQGGVGDPADTAVLATAQDGLPGPTLETLPNLVRQPARDAASEPAPEPAPDDDVPDPLPPDPSPPGDLPFPSQPPNAEPPAPSAPEPAAEFAGPEQGDGATSGNAAAA